MKINKNLLFVSTALVTTAGAVGTIVYTNTKKAQSLSLVDFEYSTYFPYGSYAPLSWLWHHPFKWYDGEGYQEINEDIWLTYHDVYGDGNTRSKIKAYARAKLSYQYQTYKTNIFRQDYVDWSSKAQSYIEFLNGNKFVIDGLEQTLTSSLSGIGTPTLEFGISSEPSFSFGSSTNISGKSISETLWTQKAPELATQSTNRAWIWTLWSFSQALNARYRAKSTSFSFRSSPAIKPNSIIFLLKPSWLK